MFEKPMGVLAILEEESLFPKATDDSFAAKLHANLLGKCGNFSKPDPKPDPNAHFAIIHYAAKVNLVLTDLFVKLRLISRSRTTSVAGWIRTRTP